MIFYLSLVTGSSAYDLEVSSPIWTWTTTSLLSESSTFSAQMCDVEADFQGNIHVVWADSDSPFPTVTYDVLYRRWDVETKSWGAIELVSPLQNSSSTVPKLDVDQNGNVHVVWKEAFTLFKDQFDEDICYSMRNSTTGEWMYTGNVPLLVSRASSETSSSPTIDVGNNGIVAIAWSDSTDTEGAGGDVDIFMRYYNMTSKQLSSLQVASGSNYYSHNPDISMNPVGDIQMVWIEEDAGTFEEIAYKYFDMESQSWSGQVYLTTDVTNSEAGFPSIVTESQYVHVIWNDGYDNLLDSGLDRDIFYKRMDTSLGTWTDLALLTPECGGQSDDPRIALDLQGNLYMVWKDSSNIGGTIGNDVDVLLKYWNKTTNTWGPINVISTESGMGSTQAEVCVDPFNFIHVAWADVSDFAGADTDQDIFYKKFAGLPYTPELSSISPNPDTDGTLNLQWTSSFGAQEYSIYRDTEEINSLTGLTPLATTLQNSFTDTISSSGLYYYVITAKNPVGESVLSNSESVTVNLPIDTTTVDTTVSETTSMESTEPSETEPTSTDVNFAMVFTSIVGIALLAQIKKKLR